MSIALTPAEVAYFRRKINHQLEPIKVMLVNRKDEMSKEKWIRFVYLTRKSIIEHPDQYLEADLPPQATIDTIVGQLFEEFLNREIDGDH